MKIKDISGMKFGRLRVINLYGIRLSGGQGLAFWNCICDCGRRGSFNGASLRKGNTLSCGCLLSEKRAAARKTHGKSRSSIYEVWCGIRKRCNNPNCKAFKNYGGRGISVCPRWDRFESFLEDMGSGYRRGLTIERKNNDGDYSKENCVWATRIEQANNKRGNHNITFGGVTKSVSEWAKSVGISPRMLNYRVHLGWPMKDCLNKPNRYSKHQDKSL